MLRQWEFSEVNYWDNITDQIQDLFPIYKLNLEGRSTMQKSWKYMLCLERSCSGNIGLFSRCVSRTYQRLLQWMALLLIIEQARMAPWLLVKFVD